MSIPPSSVLSVLMALSRSLTLLDTSLAVFGTGIASAPARQTPIPSTFPGMIIVYAGYEGK